MRLFKTALVGLAVMIGAYAIAFGLGLLAFDLLEVSDREGGNAMALAFLICPLVAVVAALIAAIWYFVATGRRRQQEAAQRSSKPPLVMAGAAAVTGFLAGKLLQWILYGQLYETWTAAFTVSMAPWIGAVLLGGIVLSLASGRVVG